MPSMSHRVGVLQESAIRKLDALVRAQQDVRFHRLNIGQPDVATPAPLLEAIRAFQPEVIAYGPASGLPSCRQAAADYHGRWSPGLEERHVAVTVGGSEALLFAFTAACDPGDTVLALEPYYTNYNGFATVAGAKVKAIRTHLADDFRIPSDAELDRYIDPSVKAIVFSNPANPTGAVYGKEELARLLAWAERHDLFVIADEVYRRIWFDQPPTSALEFPEHADRVMVVDSMSKTYSACGLRLGFLICRNEAFMEKVERLGQARLGTQPLAQHVAIAALSLDDAYYDAVRATYKKRVDTMVDALSGIEGVRAPRPAGAFYSMVELPIDDADRFARFLITEFREDGESVVVAPGPGFYADPSNGTNQIRLAAVVEEPKVARAVDLLGKALAVYPGRA